jgi:hypothetical protein
MDDIRGVDPIYKGVSTANGVVLAQGREKNSKHLSIRAAKHELAVLRMRCQV